MRGIPESVLRRIAGQFTERPVEQGEVLCLEGEVVNAAWIVAEGGVDIIRNVGGERAEFLTTMKKGDLFGQNGLQSANSTRTASCVASKAGWLYQIDPVASRALDGEAWRVWNETLLHSFIEQVRRSNLALGTLVVGTREAERPKAVTSDQLASILNARGALEGGALDDELDQMDFVVDDAARREAHGRKR
jgi:CRP-like cAMP-binding protein